MGHAYGFFWRCRAINDIAHLTSYRDAIGVPCIRAQSVIKYYNNVPYVSVADSGGGAQGARAPLRESQKI